MKTAICIHQYTTESESILQQPFSLFTPNNQMYIEQEILSELQLRSDKFNSAKSFASFEGLNTSYDIMLTMGGDSTLLKGITYARSLQVPILDVNTERLGFLTTVHENDLPNVLEQLRKGDYQMIECSVIKTVFADAGEPIDTVGLALNEITTIHENTVSMMTVSTELNGDYLYSYWVDGLIITTPTGPTGYSLSYAGSVILPTAKNFVLTPITLHNLDARPVIVPEDVEVRLSISGHEEKFLMSLDSHTESIPNRQSIIVRKVPFVAKMIRLEGDSFTETFRTRLLWGEGKRNK